MSYKKRVPIPIESSQLMKVDDARLYKPETGHYLSIEGLIPSSKIKMIEKLDESLSVHIEPPPTVAPRFQVNRHFDLLLHLGSTNIKWHYIIRYCWTTWKDGILSTSTSTAPTRR